MRQVKIYCPKCEYVPVPADRWMCLPKCGCFWNTFETCGVCPKCGKNWEDTACPLCGRWSPHVDWYHELLPDDQESLEETTPVTEPASAVNLRRGSLSQIARRTLWQPRPALARLTAILLGVFLLMGTWGCRSKPDRAETAIGIQGWVNSPGYYLRPQRAELSVNDLVGLADGLPGAGLQEMARGRRITADLIHQSSGRHVLIKPEKWGTPLRDLGIEVQHYNLLKIEITPLVPLR